MNPKIIRLLFLTLGATATYLTAKLYERHNGDPDAMMNDIAERAKRAFAQVKGAAFDSPKALDVLATSTDLTEIAVAVQDLERLRTVFETTVFETDLEDDWQETLIKNAIIRCCSELMNPESLQHLDHKAAIARILKGAYWIGRANMQLGPIESEKVRRMLATLFVPVRQRKLAAMMQNFASDELLDLCSRLSKYSAVHEMKTDVNDVMIGHYILFALGAPFGNMQHGDLSSELIRRYCSEEVSEKVAA